MLFGRAVDALVGSGLFPLAEMGVLRGDVRKLVSFEGVYFDVVDIAFDFAFVLRSVRTCWNDGGLIVISEGEDLGMKFRIVPVGLFDGGFEVVDTESGGDAAEVAKGVLDGCEEVIGTLCGKGLGVAFA